MLAARVFDLKPESWKLNSMVPHEKSHLLPKHNISHNKRCTRFWQITQLHAIYNMHISSGVETNTAMRTFKW